MNQKEIHEQLHADLVAAAEAIEDAACDLFIASKSATIADYPAALQRIRKLNEHADRLNGYARDVKSGLIKRALEAQE
ncbi:hypothetical protein [Pseudomonas sp. TE24901]